jgi:ATP-binding cassette, subfamily B, bacterial
VAAGQWQLLRGFTHDPSVTQQQLAPGTLRRIVTYARPYRGDIALYLLATALDAIITVTYSLLLRALIDDGIERRDTRAVVAVAGSIAGLALLDALLNCFQTWHTARAGQGLIFDLRTAVFRHVERQPIAFFARAETGALVSRLNSDVIGAQQAITYTLSSVVSSVLQLVLVLAIMAYLSWLVTVIALVLLPVFLLPAKLVGRRLQRLTRESMQLDADLSSIMTERFNVAGATLVKLFGRPSEEDQAFRQRAGRVRDISVITAMYGRVFFIALSLLASMALAVTYGAGGLLVIRGAFPLGTLVALATMLYRLYTPITALSNVQVAVMTALVSFDRVFEVLDMRPLVEDRPGAAPIRGLAGPGQAPLVEFRDVSFRYPAAHEVSLGSLESAARSVPERAGRPARALREVSFVAPPGSVTALVGPSGAGKSTIACLMARLYDPIGGAVLIAGQDLRDVSLESLRDTVGVVTQDGHLFHDTIRANLLYARPGAGERELREACRAAQIWDLIRALPDGLDTVVGENGYRLSGGERQRVALARILLKAPRVVVLDEATAHLDSESEAAVQRALPTALAGRTAVVVAHRLSTVRGADQILVVDSGRIRERGRHEDLLAAGGLYAQLYRTQFAGTAGP